MKEGLKRSFRVETSDHGVVIFGCIRAEQLVALLETWDTDELEMIPDVDLAHKLGAVLAMPWQVELASKWHDEVDKKLSESKGVAELIPKVKLSETT